VAHSDNPGSQGRGERRDGAEQRPAGPGGVVDGLANRPFDGWREKRPDAGGFAAGDRAEGRAAGPESSGLSGGSGPTNGFWRDADWLFCRDGKWRPVESGTFPLVVGATSRVGRLRAYGNAIVAPVAEAFIRAYMETQAR
jgi:DNA (cytosine-5)-methyltransferase 1